MLCASIKAATIKSLPVIAAACVPRLWMWRYIASTSAISWGVAFLAAAAIHRRPRCDVYQVRPSTLHTDTYKNALLPLSAVCVPTKSSLWAVFTPPTSWCLWPRVRPMAGACWGTSLHQTSPAALCLGGAVCSVLLLPCPQTDSFAALRSSCRYQHLQRSQTIQKCIHPHHYHW